MIIDLHTHTYYSKDAIQSPADLVKAAKAKGLDGIAVTDHNSTKAWKEALAAGKRNKIGVIPGEEIVILHDGHTAGEVLGLFLNEEIAPGGFNDVRDHIREQDGILIVAHPFDVLRDSFKRLEECKKDFEAVEVLNARSVFGRFNAKALDFAKANGIAGIGGSDAHCRFEVGKASTAADIDDIEGLRRAIKKRETKAVGGKSNPLVHLVSTAAMLHIIGRH